MDQQQICNHDKTLEQKQDLPILELGTMPGRLHELLDSLASPQQVMDFLTSSKSPEKSLLDCGTRSETPLVRIITSRDLGMIGTVASCCTRWSRVFHAFPSSGLSGAEAMVTNELLDVLGYLCSKTPDIFNPWTRLPQMRFTDIPSIVHIAVVVFLSPSLSLLLVPFFLCFFFFLCLHVPPTHPPLPPPKKI